MKASRYAPLGQAYLDYWGGDAKAAYSYERDDGFKEEHLLGDYFRSPGEFSPLEKKAFSAPDFSGQ